ncbi:MAG TPA: AAC(3) family N-acetyltransferase [Gemmatimonadaceae bacterium]|nr:AAC(3) family N-acetyltransferase [Gemmatimonadaceae bacterium]
MPAEAARVFSRSELADDFRRLGVAAGDTVMLHASVRAVGEVAGGPDQIHLALKDALTDAGTLIMYTGCPDHYDNVGRGHLTEADEREILARHPAYDAQTVRSARDNGILVEFLRTYPGSRVNDHVTRFVAWGRQAEYLLSETPWDYAFGRGSPMERFREVDGRILLLGCDHDTVTFLHHAEHVVDIPGRRVARFKVPVMEQGQRVWRDMEEFDSGSAGAHANWPERFFALLTDAYLARTRNEGGTVGNATSYLFAARELFAFALPVMREIAADARAAGRLREPSGTR